MRKIYTFSLPFRSMTYKYQRHIGSPRRFNSWINQFGFIALLRDVAKMEAAGLVENGRLIADICDAI